MTDTFNPASLVSRTLDTVLANIIAGKYGSSLPPQETLAKELGVSRVVMREALVILRFCRVLTIRPKTGTKINDRSVWRPAILGAQENSASVAAIQFALEAPEGMTWLRLWNEGSFESCRREWPEAPAECYAGAEVTA